jgi:tyrosyl-tRNA synthetase
MTALLISLFFILGNLVSMLHSLRTTCYGLKKSLRRLSFQKIQSSIASTTTIENDEISDTSSPIPTTFKSQFLQLMHDRGYLFQCTDYTGLDDKLSNNIIPAYLGFDATAKSLHVGSLLQIMILRNLQKTGHKPVVLIGGGTTKVGDPTGKDESRKLLSNEIIQENMQSLSSVFQKFLKFGDGPTDAIMVNNADWLDHLNYLSFLRDYGRMFTINRMLSFDSVKQRLAREQPLTFLEFNYMLLQSYDFVELYKRYSVQLELGGSDQWGNIVSGVELGRKLQLKQPLFGLTAPLITTSDGKKMGKTAAGAVWLNR